MENEMDNNQSPIGDFNFEQSTEGFTKEQTDRLDYETHINSLLCDHEKRLNALQLWTDALSKQVVSRVDVIGIALLSGVIGSALTYSVI